MVRPKPERCIFGILRRIIGFSGFSKLLRSFRFFFVSSSKLVKNSANPGIRADFFCKNRSSTNRYAETATARLEMVLAFSPKFSSMMLSTSLIRFLHRNRYAIFFCSDAVIVSRVRFSDSRRHHCFLAIAVARDMRDAMNLSKLSSAMGSR